MLKVDEKIQRQLGQTADIIEEFAELSRQYEQEFATNKSVNSDFTSNMIKDKATLVRNGEFKIIVCGRFKNGKSTFVNALLEKETMAAKATACTAVIAVVNYGTNENTVTVVYNDKSTKKMSLVDFTEEFQLTEQEQNYIEEQATRGEDIVFDRFKDVDHVEMQSRHPMFESGCSLIDTPGLEEALARDKTTNKYLPQADAVVFMLNALALFSQKERQFIDQHFAGKHKNNVFFVINRVNQLQPGQLENQVMPAVKDGLRSCFIDERGKYDESLYNRRVFYVNAYGALCSVTGKEESIFVNGRWMSFPVDKSTTGMPEYEESQMDFINDPDGRVKATTTEAINMLANIYKDTIQQTKAKINSMAMSDSRRKEAAKIAREALQKAEGTVKKIEEAFTHFGTLAANTLFLDLMNYFDKSIKGEWPAYVNSNITKAHYKTLAQVSDAAMAAVSILPIKAWRRKRDELYQRHMQLISDELDRYISDKMQIWKTQSSVSIKSASDDLTKELNKLCDEFDMHIEASVTAFSGVNVSPQEQTGKGKLQTAIALILGKDVSTVVDISNAGGSISWGQLAGKYLGQVVIDSILIAIAPQAILFKFGIDALIIAFKAEKSAKNRALAIGEIGITRYKEQLKNSELKFKSDIVKNISETKAKVSKPSREILAAEKVKVDQLANEHKHSEAEEEKIRRTLETITQSMRGKIEQLYALVYGRKPTEKEFNQLGSNAVKSKK